MTILLMGAIKNSWFLFEAVRLFCTKREQSVCGEMAFMQRSEKGIL
jgi:hypothetical protein